MGLRVWLRVWTRAKDGQGAERRCSSGVTVGVGCLEDDAEQIWGVEPRVVEVEVMLRFHNRDLSLKKNVLVRKTQWQKE